VLKISHLLNKQQDIQPSFSKLSASKRLLVMLPPHFGWKVGPTNTKECFAMLESFRKHSIMAGLIPKHSSDFNAFLTAVAGKTFFITAVTDGTVL